jgi:hypothetical protein
MSKFLNTLKDKLRVMEEKIKALPAELDSIAKYLDRAKLESLLLRLNCDCDKLYDKQSNAQLWGSGVWANNMLVFPFILFPDGINGPVYRRITSEDIAKWRQAYKTKLHVVIGKGRVEVIAASELAREYKTTVSQVILAAQQQGYTVLGWEQYLKLLDEIGKLIARDGGQDEAALSKRMAQMAIGIPVTVMDSAQEVRILGKSERS